MPPIATSWEFYARLVSREARYSKEIEHTYDGSAGNVSTGFMQATSGDMKSLRSSGERMALISKSASAQAPLEIVKVTPQ